MMNRVFRMREFGVVVILIVLAVALEIKYRALHGTTFFSGYNLDRISIESAFIAIAAIGSAMVIISGGIDLSSGSMMALGVTTVGFCYVELGLPPFVCVAIVVLAGLVLGGCNGLLISGLGMPAFIATLGMLWIAKGIAFELCELAITISWKASPPLIFTVLGEGTFFTLLLLTVVFAAFMVLTKWGRYIYAIGGNEEAARFSGVPVGGVKIGVYAVAGVLSALAGAAMALQYGTATSGMGIGYELRIIAAVVVGGISLAGGEGSIIGAVLGAVVLRLLNEILVLYDVPDSRVDLVFGLTLVGVVAIDLGVRRGWFGRLKNAIRKKGA